MNLPLTKKEQREKTYQTLFNTYGIRNSGIIGTLTSLYYLTIGYFTNYPRHLIYCEILDFIQKKNEENNEEIEEE
jgi:hypothetical protein